MLDRIAYLQAEAGGIKWRKLPACLYPISSICIGPLPACLARAKLERIAS